MLNPALANYGNVYAKQANFHYMTSRGCPYFCNFCASNKVNGRTMRYHTLERVRYDLTRLRDNLGAKTIVMQDDNFMGSGDDGRKRALQIINIIGELGLTVVFQNSLTLFALKRPILEAMRNAGVTQLVLAVESGSARVLRQIMHKPPLHCPPSSRDYWSSVFTPSATSLLATCESEDDIGTAGLYGDQWADWYKILRANPLVGSEFYDDAVAEGLIPIGGLANLDFKMANISTKELSAERVTFWQYYLNLEVNFVKNQNWRLAEEATKEGRHEDAIPLYRKALLGFDNSIDGKADHLFGHHYAALCYDRLGETDKAAYHRAKAIQSSQDPFWQTWLGEFPQIQVGQTLPALATKRTPISVKLALL